MYILDGDMYETLEDAARQSGISKQTLENHIDDQWTSRKGVAHTLTIEEVPIEVHTEERYYDVLHGKSNRKRGSRYGNIQ